jgi:hypothetical protein
MPGFLACWHRWRSAQLRKLARAVDRAAIGLITLSERLRNASMRAFVESLASEPEGDDAP